MALEFVVFKADWDTTHPGTMPELFGEMFMSTPEPNRFEIPAFYSLHVWLWKANPSGLFAPFNPRVSCDPQNAASPRLAPWLTSSRPMRPRALRLRAQRSIAQFGGRRPPDPSTRDMGTARIGVVPSQSREATRPRAGP